ncbi:MAG TPA: PEP-CTERM sorting domain-containing protein [Chromatiaceae bacterium]|nr:PEP-CTERM sorting domain-containing protein [Chromatiaceae bacterium]HIA07983.1 PEP-CTERM sorting domain-containing protein [Chromatiaceae bacterium]HIN82609.1 PEP-CTERM sorting domain-containing protein [Chromatiales bacterium]HIO14268.1 PEP-CTERM sorting domain-containing protein [Chromatiales bacterium]HIO54783.1 PEP-CTERM sorting domain-containing protein [Chromatiales bacterium]
MDDIDNESRGIDNVRIVARVPEPDILLLMGRGLGGLVVTRSRTR